MHNTILNIVILIVSHNIACNFSFLFQKKKKEKIWPNKQSWS